MLDEQTNAPVSNARITMMNKANREITQYLTDDAGYFETVLAENTSVNIGANRVGYFSTSKSKADVVVPKGQKISTKTLINQISVRMPLKSLIMW